ncbi:unnamed protein product [Ilex paraguariensis]|uniref:CsbD family protein n=1 Tax=Ilex paraguariensis TaxID=185542 RepID=A0ABC8TKP1_9AQUA
MNSKKELKIKFVGSKGGRWRRGGQQSPKDKGKEIVKGKTDLEKETMGDTADKAEEGKADQVAKEAMEGADQAKET